MRNINRVLKKNHAILQELNPEEKSTTLKNVLEKKGFNFKYHTKHVHYKNRKGVLFLLRSGLLRSGRQQIYSGKKRRKLDAS
jgi:hypothetical protein